jgi:hypothetical protein
MDSTLIDFSRKERHVNELELMRAEIEVQKVIIVALLGLQKADALPLLRVALQRSLDCHDASWPYAVSLSDEQIGYAQKYLKALIEKLPK